MRIYEELYAKNRDELNTKISNYFAQYPVVYGVIQGEPFKMMDDDGQPMWGVRMGRFRSADWYYYKSQCKVEKPLSQKSRRGVYESQPIFHDFKNFSTKKNHT